ncbi:MAG: helix-turn-helix transcriptional regulator [Gammaproteobacteria bacterium]|jgi:DNA-binding CsgD family transcriptional regulator|nr:helix-turn-helix transcriptional regulator [Gammaproteobacteria bacterium]MDP6617287.1 helix-turn-helix transcriptional regulator [Gammaproteobacteria bacterium]MDP6694065.1 helix-turn-helix transcriptional regulator [Gammaproteobacteria bacterium]
MTGTLEYIQEKISLDDWLNILSNITGADYAASERWAANEPDQSMTDSVGQSDPLRTGWRNWADHAMSAESESQGYFLNLSKGGKHVPLPLGNDIPPSEVIIFSLDWVPSRIVGVLRKMGGDEAWNGRTRKLLELLIPNMRESVELHKTFGRIQSLAVTTGDILDTAPRGIIALAPDGIIRYSNAFAESLLADNDGINRNETVFSVTDKECQKVFEEKLDFIRNCPLEDLKKADWDVALTRPSGREPYQMMVRGQVLQDWRIETTRHNRFAIIYLHDPMFSQKPSFEQLKNFYGLTTAEAKLTALLYSGMTMLSASEQLGVTVNTSRTHLRNIFSKVGVNNQGELLAKLTASIKLDG